VTAVSKKHGQRHKRRRKPPRILCARCQAPAGADAASVLTALASVLNACDDAGVKVRLREFGAQGAVYAREGYVLPLGKGRWSARTLAYGEFTPAPGDDGLDD
jgi:hypothetical protein